MMDNAPTLPIQNASLRERVRTAFGFGPFKLGEEYIVVPLLPDDGPKVTVEELQRWKYKILDRYKEART